MARGIERRRLFVRDRDRQDFLDRLRTVIPASGAKRGARASARVLAGG